MTTDTPVQPDRIDDVRTPANDRIAQEPPTLPQDPQPPKPNGLDTIERILAGEPLDAELTIICEHRVVVKLLKPLLEFREFSFWIDEKDRLTIKAQGRRISKSGPFVP